MQNQKVEMYYGSVQSYENEKRAGRINENALYFIDGILYCGYNLYTNKYEIVDTLPAIGVKNVIYKVRNDKSVAIWDSVDNMWAFIYEPNSGGISETHTHDNKSVLDKITQTLFDTWNSAVSHISDTIKHITSTERKNWNDAYAHSTSAHAPSNAEVNQNAFSNVVVGSTTISADSKTDTLTLVSGDNVTITPDENSDKITISSINTDTTYSPGAGISLDGNTFSNSGVRSIATGGTNGTISVNTNGTSTEVAIKGLGSAAYTSSSAYVSAETGTSLQSQITTNANAISTLNSNLNKGYIEVVADGTKTIKKILSEISNLIDYSKVNYESKFIIKDGELSFVFSVTQLYTNCVQLSSCNIPGSNILWVKVIQLWTDNERIQYTVSTLTDDIITLDDTLTSISKKGSVYRFIY